MCLKCRNSWYKGELWWFLKIENSQCPTVGSPQTLINGKDLQAGQDGSYLIFFFFFNCFIFLFANIFCHSYIHVYDSLSNGETLFCPLAMITFCQCMVIFICLVLRYMTRWKVTSHSRTIFRLVGTRAFIWFSFPRLTLGKVRNYKEGLIWFLSAFWPSRWLVGGWRVFTWFASFCLVVGHG